MSGRNRGRTHTEKMPWWKAVFLDVVFAAAAVGLTFVFVRMWIERRTERTWPVVVGIVRTLEERPGHKGRPVIYLVGEYQTDGGPRRFSVVWDGCDYQDRTWVPPEGTPPVGSKVLLHAAPNDPSRVALDSNPTQDSTASDVIEFAVLLLACIAGAIAVWFQRHESTRNYLSGRVSAALTATDPEGRWRIGVVAKRTLNIVNGTAVDAPAQLPLVEEPVMDEGGVTLGQDLAERLARDCEASGRRGNDPRRDSLQEMSR